MTSKASKKQQALIELGGKILVRLEEQRASTGSHIHIDTLRFTVQRGYNTDGIFYPDLQEYKRLFAIAQEEQSSTSEHVLVGGDITAYTQAMELANEVSEALGAGFDVDFIPRKGKDFYRHRISIIKEGQECAWVGFLASSNKKAQKAQDATIHVYIQGHACTFARSQWRAEVQRIIKARDAVITRVDLALDIFEAPEGFMERIESDYNHGLMDVCGKTPKWEAITKKNDGIEHSRSYYVGSREAGKCTNIYEKGDQLFGHEANSHWTRIELRYGNKLRYIDHDVLERPADFFAGASEWHAQILREHSQEQRTPEPIKTLPKLQLQTIEAEAERNSRWLLKTAKASIGMAFQFLDEDSFLELVTSARMPGRLKKFNLQEIRHVYNKAFRRCAGIAANETCEPLAA